MVVKEVFSYKQFENIAEKTPTAKKSFAIFVPVLTVRNFYEEYIEDNNSFGKKTVSTIGRI